MTKPALIGAILALTAGSAAADVTPRQVWDDWSSALAEGESNLSTEAIEEGDGRLTVRGLVLSTDAGEDSYEIRLEELVLEQVSGGEVRVTTSPSYPVRAQIAGGDGAALDLTFEVRHPELELTVSGEGRPAEHTYEAPAIDLELVEARRDGAPIELDVAARFAEVAGSYAVAGEVEDRTESAFSAAEMTVTGSGTSPGGEGSFDLSARVTELAADNVSSLLDESGQMAEALRAGGGGSGTLNHGPSSYSLDLTHEAEDLSIQAASESGTVHAEIGGDGVTYSGRNTGTQMLVSGSDIPVPEVQLAIDESSAEFSLPLLAREAAQPYGLELRLDGVSLGEAAWSALDPAGVLPRDPATLALDLSGTARLDQDVPLDSAPAAEETPGALETLALDELLIRALGAELTGTGGFEFAEGATPPDGGPALPQPVGQVTLRLQGANALIDRLSQMGALPEGQAPAARMMLGLFARPVEGEDDALTSTIEFTEDGGISANGTRLR